MKTYGKFIALAIVLGAILAFFFYKDIKTEVMALTSNDGYVDVFQVGVYKERKNAMDAQSNYPGSFIYQDKEYFRLFVGVTISNQEKLKNYFNSLDYDYYLKKMQVDSKTYEKLKNYDEVLSKSTKDTTIKVLCQEMNTLFLEKES